MYNVLKTRSSWLDIVSLDKYSVEDLEWWLQALDTWNGAPIKAAFIDIQVTSDASSS